MANHVTKAVIPAAGLGTRFLPATKAMPKEMLPVVDKPAIQYVVEEAVTSGLNDVLLITGRNKNALENHFDRNAELEDALEKKGDRDKLLKVSYSTSLADMHYVRQGDPKGLGHAVLRAKMHIGHEPFAVLLGDDIIDERDPLLTRMLHVEHAPSNYAVIGRYVLRPEIFDILEKTAPGKGGEIQLTDALEGLATAPAWTGGVHGVVFRGRRYDTGDRLDYLKAVVRLALERDDLGPPLRDWLTDHLAA